LLSPCAQPFRHGLKPLRAGPARPARRPASRRLPST